MPSSKSSSTAMPPPRSPAEARAAAKTADARAEAAWKAAKQAKAAAKGARKTAAKAEADAVRLRLEADPERKLRSELSPDQAKARLMEAARAIHPIQDARVTMSQHPMTTVGVAAGAGFVLGSSGNMLGNVVGGGLKLTGAALAILKPFAGTFAKLAAAQFAVQQAANAQADAAPKEVHVHEAPDA